MLAGLMCFVDNNIRKKLHLNIFQEGNILNIGNLGTVLFEFLFILFI